jgi:hypothetical protein
MAKKQIDKKKISIKLLSGQTYLVLDAEQMFQVSTALVHLASITKDDKERLEILKIGEEATRAIADNKYVGDVNNEDEW